MKLLNNKVLLTPITQENTWGYEDKDATKIGQVAYPFKGEKIELKKGDEVYYQYGQDAQIEGQKFIIVNEGNLICQK